MTSPSKNEADALLAEYGPVLDKLTDFIDALEHVPDVVLASMLSVFLVEKAGPLVAELMVKVAAAHQADASPSERFLLELVKHRKKGASDVN